MLFTKRFWDGLADGSITRVPALEAAEREGRRDLAIARTRGMNVEEQR